MHTAIIRADTSLSSAQKKHIASLHVVVSPEQTMSSFMEVVKQLREVRRTRLCELPDDWSKSLILGSDYSVSMPGACTVVSPFNLS